MTNKQVIQGFMEAINDRRTEDLATYMAADVTDHNKIIHGAPDEPGAAFEGIRRQLAAFDPLQMQVDELIGEGDRVVARLTMTGTHTGAHPRMPEPTKRDFRVETIFIFTLADGKITEIRAVNDRLGMFLQLGWDWPEIG